MIFRDFMISVLFYAVKSSSHYLNSYPKHDLGHPSEDLIAIYHSGFDLIRGERNMQRSPIIKMSIKAKLPCINIDNLYGLESVECRNNDRLHVMTSKDISIENWNISRGIAFLINSRWRCMGKEEALFLQTSSCEMISAREFIFRVSNIHPKDVIDEYEFVIRPNNEYHRNLLFYNHVSEKQYTSKDIQKPFNYTYTGPLVDTRRILNSTLNNYLQILCEKCTVEGTTELSARIKGPGIFKKAQAIIETGLGSALNLNLTLVLKSVGKLLEGINWTQKIFQSKLFGWSVPGIFSPGSIYYF